MKKSRLPRLYLLVASLLGTMFVSVNVYYRLGAEGVGFRAAGGNGLSFNRDFDFAMFRIDDDTALVVSGGGYRSVAKYGRGIFPFCPLCGIWEAQGGLLNGAEFYKDGWFYGRSLDRPRNAPPGVPTAVAYNARTHEALHLASPVSGDVPAEAVPEYKSRGLTFEPRYQVTPGMIKANWQSLSTINESCMIFNAAFIVLFVLLAVVGLILLFMRRRAQ